ncbi:methyltransferase domain-containing protein [Yimella sp. cx-51]|uniref:THUMP-like domain-containing protein n=1 Tax=Yimella sp. cx-51 TaxID=2770551 RepID=UPI00165E197F|nr:methyltransferase domain-containing protein [Yimella sp. cx-51]MBC9958254.1 methyltransferase domain-containing protein [Yimella sp. cx-51]QTH38718.1 methyltransferase domain-containing protein [Yimella sp. cx-51]
MDASRVHRLLEPEGLALLHSLPPYDESQVLPLTGTLRAQGHDPALISAALTQSALRQRGATKFGEAAARMLFTPDGLEQATRPQIARMHADRFVAVGAREVYDLGCGIGADARAFAQAGLRVHAIERDPATAAIARANLAEFPDAVVEVADAEAIAIPEDAAVWLDPARRTTGVADITGRTRRTFRLDQLQPSWDFVTALGASGRPVGAKLSPSFPIAALAPGASAIWTSFAGEVLECAVWFGPAADEHAVTACVLQGDDLTVVRARPSAQARLVDGTGHLRRYLYEADKAVVRAGLAATLACDIDGFELSPGLGHATSDHERDVPYARRYEITDVLPFHPKALRHWAREHGLGGITFKKRGVTFDDARLTKQLKLPGRGPRAIVLVTRVGDGTAALVLEHSG